MGRKLDSHGTWAWYVNKKCRCDLCRLAMRNYFRDYRKKKKTAAQEVGTTVSPIGDSQERSVQDV